MTREPAKEQLAEFSALVGGLAHEIKNPLSTINLNLELLKEDWTSDGSALATRSVRKINVLLQESRRLEQMLAEFLRLASTADLDEKPVNLNALLEDVLDFVAADCRNRNIQVASQFDGSLPLVSLDENLIRQALLNLLKNSFEAMEERGGVITIQTSASPEAALVEIIDTGAGMSAEALERAFQAYYSTKASGTGLGLPTVKKIIERHGGSVECASAVGKGTRFRLIFPLDSNSEA